MQEGRRKIQTKRVLINIPPCEGGRGMFLSKGKASRWKVGKIPFLWNIPLAPFTRGRMASDNMVNKSFIFICTD